MQKIRKKKIKTLYIVVSIILLLYAVTMFMPIYFITVNSLKKPSQFFMNPWNVSSVLYVANYIKVLKLSVGEVSISQMYVNSIIYTCSAMVISAMATTVTAYTVARFNFIGKELLVSIGIGAMLIPDLGSRSVVYKMYVDLHVIDTWFVLFQFAMPFGLMFLIVYSMFKTTSTTYAEAAKMDGANKLQIIRYITIPSIKGIIIMMTILKIGKIFYGDFGLFYNLTLNSPLLYETTDVLDTYVYRALMTLGDVGLSSAVGFVQSVLGFILVIVTNLVVRRLDKDSALF